MEPVTTDVTGPAPIGPTFDWGDLPAKQQPTWTDPAALEEAVATLRGYPPLVFAG